SAQPPNRRDRALWHFPSRSDGSIVVAGEREVTHQSLDGLSSVLGNFGQSGAGFAAAPKAAAHARIIRARAISIVMQDSTKCRAQLDFIKKRIAVCES